VVGSVTWKVDGVVIEMEFVEAEVCIEVEVGVLI